jgi:probable phosphoglycerate mutase
VTQPSLFGDCADRQVVANIDGGSRGNPGPAGYGVLIRKADGSVVELMEPLGVCTNNVAEYRGLIAALQWAASHRVDSLLVRSDSELLVRQMRGEYRVRNAGLRPLHDDARALARRIGTVRFEHVRRELNVEADRLANLAMDRAATAGS